MSPDFECSGNSFSLWLEAQPSGWPAEPVTEGRVWREPAPGYSRGTASRTGDSSCQDQQTILWFAFHVYTMKAVPELQQ